MKSPLLLNSKTQKGFTLVELLLIIGIATILFGFITVNLMRAQRTTSVATAAETLIADIKSQQIKAMNGSSQAMSKGDSYGVSFDGATYTLFYGNNKHNDVTDYTVAFDGPLTVSATTNPIVFLPLSGELAAPVTVTLSNTAGSEKEVFSLNAYGVIYDIHN